MDTSFSWWESFSKILYDMKISIQHSDNLKLIWIMYTLFTLEIVLALTVKLKTKYSFNSIQFFVNVWLKMGTGRRR